AWASVSGRVAVQAVQKARPGTWSGARGAETLGPGGDALLTGFSAPAPRERRSPDQQHPGSERSSSGDRRAARRLPRRASAGADSRGSSGAQTGGGVRRRGRVLHVAHLVPGHAEEGVRLALLALEGRAAGGALLDPRSRRAAVLGDPDRDVEHARA